MSFYQPVYPLLPYSWRYKWWILLVCQIKQTLTNLIQPRQSLEYTRNISIHRLLRAWSVPKSTLKKLAEISIHRLLRAWSMSVEELEKMLSISIHRLLRAWSLFDTINISYWHISIHRLLRAWSSRTKLPPLFALNFNPQALTSLITLPSKDDLAVYKFQSTGSYEPDPFGLMRKNCVWIFQSTGSYKPDPDRYV